MNHTSPKRFPVDRAISITTLSAMIFGYLAVFSSRYYEVKSDHRMTAQHDAIIRRLDKSDVTQHLIMEQNCAMLKDHEERLRSLEYSRRISMDLDDTRREARWPVPNMAVPSAADSTPKTYTAHKPASPGGEQP